MRAAAGTGEGLGDTRSGSLTSESGRIGAMPEPYPQEFRDDVVRVDSNLDSISAIA